MVAPHLGARPRRNSAVNREASHKPSSHSFTMLEEDMFG